MSNYNFDTMIENQNLKNLMQYHCYIQKDFIYCQIMKTCETYEKLSFMYIQPDPEENTEIH